MVRIYAHLSEVKMRSRRTILVFVIFNIISISTCRRLSLKESLTAYAEKSEEEQNNSTTLTSQGNETSLHDSGHSENSTASANLLRNGKRFSLLEITKSFRVPPSPKGNRNHIGTTRASTTISSTTQSSMSLNNGSKSDVNKNSYYPKDSLSGTLPNVPTKENPQQVWQKFFLTVKSEVENMKGKWDNTNRKTSSRSNISKALQKIPNTTEKDLLDDHHQQQSPLRSKKEVSNLGLRDLMWNTATALWSVNKEHFLPTFLHTKTGGKLSLIRDSIFKPVAILTQFTNGIQEINNEKWNNLARLTPTGWTRPSKSQVVVIKVQPENSRLWTLARYVFRLTKHTVITKWRLKRALLDLQLRALRKLLRIISSKNVHQKISTIKILTNAILRGKLGLLNGLAGKGYNGTYYHGKDNSAHVDITYSSLNSQNNEWQSYNQYEPPSSEFLPFRPMSPTSRPPSKINYYHYEAPQLSGSSPAVSYAAPDEPLIDSPSYANLLETMGIHPTSYDYDGENNKNVAISSSSAPLNVAPLPTVVYYSSALNTTATPSAHITTPSPYKSSLIEKPAASYSFHYSSAEPSNDLVPHSSSLKSYLSSIPSLEGNHSPYGSTNIEEVPYGSVYSSSTKSTTTTPSPFRLRLLESMSAATGFST